MTDTLNSTRTMMERIKIAIGKCPSCGKYERSIFGNLCLNPKCVDNPAHAASAMDNRAWRQQRIEDGVMIALGCTSIDRRSPAKMREAAAQITCFVERELDR